jgi:hypothetical protein
VRADGGWKEVLRPPLQGAAAAVLLALIAAVLSGHAGVFRYTLTHDAQDFGVFLASARHDLAGRSLYSLQPRASATGPRTAPLNLNLPHTMALLRPLARLSDGAALLTWMSLGLALGLAASIASVAALGWRLRLLPALLVALYLVAWAPSAAVTSTAQITFYVTAPVVAGWLSYRQRRSVAAGAWIGLAAAVKPFLLVFAPYFLVRRDHRALTAMLSVLGAVAAIGLAMYGPAAYAEWLRQLPAVTWSAHFLNASLLGVIQRLIGRSGHATLASAPGLVAPLFAALALAVGLVTFRAVRRPARNARQIDGDWAAVLLASLLMSPLGWNYYLWIAVWPVAAVIAAVRPWRQARRADAWLVPGLAGWLWWGAMTEWGQPHPLATLTAASLYFWALLSVWIWTLVAIRRDVPVAVDNGRGRADTGP